MKDLIYLISMTILLSSCGQSPDGAGIEVLPDMFYSQAYEAYGESELSSDKKAMMMPVPGTIARGKIPYPYQNTDQDAERAGKELINPEVNSPQALSRGQVVYENYCLVCHGPKGEGDGPIIPKFPNPPAFKTKRVMAHSDGRLFHIISVGSGDMPGHKEQIEAQDRWFVVHYLRKLQKD